MENVISTENFKGLTAHDVATSLLQIQNKFISDTDPLIESIPTNFNCNSSKTETIIAARANIVTLFDKLKDLEDKQPEEFRHKLDQLLDASHDIIDELEPSALSEKINTDKPVARIIRIIDDNYKPHRDGSPNLIAVANHDKGSAYEQFQQISTAIFDPLRRYVESGEIVCAVLYGSTQDSPKKPGDLDYLLLVRKSKLALHLKADEPATSEAEKLIKEVATQSKWTGAIHFKIVGDDITRHHSLSIRIEDVDEFKEKYDINADDPHYTAIMRDERSINVGYDTAKALSYSSTDTTFEQRIAFFGAQIFLGENIKDKNGKEVFKYRDNDLLK